MKQITITLSCCLSLLLNGPAQRPLLAISTVSSALLQTPEHGGRIETKYDGFNYETVVTLKKMRITCGATKGLQSTLKDTCVSVLASLHSPGIQLDYVRYAKLQLIFETKDWDRRHPIDQRNLIVVADGETLKLGTMVLVKQDLDTDRLVDVMKEVLEVSLPYQTFNKIAHAEMVEMKVGNTIFELRDKNIAALRDLNNRVKL
jgi:hypothetical protein